MWSGINVGVIRDKVQFIWQTNEIWVCAALLMYNQAFWDLKLYVWDSSFWRSNNRSAPIFKTNQSDNLVLLDPEMIRLEFLKGVKLLLFT